MDTNTGTLSIDFSNPYTARMLNSLARKGYAKLATISFGQHDGREIHNSDTDFAVVDVIEKLKNDIPDWCGNKDDCLKTILARMGELRNENQEGLGDELPNNIVQYIGDAYDTVNAMSDSSEAPIKRKPGRQTYVNPDVQSKGVHKREGLRNENFIPMPVGSGFKQEGAYGAIHAMNQQDGTNEEEDDELNEGNENGTSYDTRHRADMWKPSQEMINGVVDRFGYRA